MKVSVIITSWNTQRLLSACLTSLRAYPSTVPMEVIVVDNASSDGSADMVAKDFPEVRLIRSAINTGYAGGNNIGYAAALGEYILLLGSDTEVLPGSLQTLVDLLDGDAGIGIAAGRLEFPDGRLQMSCKQFPTIGNAVAMYCSLNFLNHQYFMSDFAHDTQREVDQPDATCVMIRRAALDGTIFREQFSILYNDVDLCQRVKRSGWSILFTPASRIIHHGSQSTKQAPPKVRLVMYQNILLYYQTYFGLAARFLLAPILVLRYIAATRDLRGVSLLYSLNKASLT